MSETEEPAVGHPSAVRPHPKSRFKRLSPGAKYGILFMTLAVLIIAGQLILHAMQTEPRDTRAIASRELAVNVLQPDERVEHVISVTRRMPIDYYRATHGLLALTNKRMIFLGLRPRDMLAPSDAPPTFEEDDFPLDTAVSVRTGRAMAFLTKGVVIRTSDETMRLSVPATSWPEAQKLVAQMTTSKQSTQADVASQDALREVAEKEWKQAVTAWHKAQYYTVRRGDALGGVATQWNTTTEQLQKLNNLPNINIRVGQTLLVREAM